MLSDNHRSLQLTSAHSELPSCSWLGSRRREFCGIDQQYVIVYVTHNTPPERKLFDNKAELDGRIEACLRIMDLPDEMREPKWYPIMM